MPMSDNYDKWMNRLEDIESADPEEEDALQTALDAMAFAQSLWNHLKENGLYTAKEDPDFDVMQRAIDLLYGELHAATMFLSDTAFERIPEVFDGIAESLDTARKGVHGDSVPPEVIRGYRDFANRVRSAQAYQRSLMTAEKEETHD